MTSLSISFRAAQTDSVHKRSHHFPRPRESQHHLVSTPHELVQKELPLVRAFSVLREVHRGRYFRERRHFHGRIVLENLSLGVAGGDENTTQPQQGIVEGTGRIQVFAVPHPFRRPVELDDILPES